MAYSFTYSSIDGFRRTRSYKTLAGARRAAQEWVGSHPDISLGFRYAVSFDGVGKVHNVHGCTLADLFPNETMEQVALPREEWAGPTLRVDFEVLPDERDFWQDGEEREVRDEADEEGWLGDCPF
jgi:hypothetical protein